jgi:AraC family transcriptional regulator
VKPDTRSFYEVAVRKVAEAVAADLDRALDLDELARTAAMSPFHFHRVFRGMIGETPLSLQRRLRLERAASALLETDEPVTTVAFSAGYETHESFTRAFRFAYDAAPSEFRRRRERTCAGPPLPRVTLAARSGLHYDAGRVDASRLHIIRGEVPMNVTIKDMPEYRVATVRHVGPYMQISQAFARLGDIAGPAGLIGRDTIMLAMYHDDPETTPPQDLRSDAALTVADDARLPEGLSDMHLPAGRYAMTTHVGPYEQLGDVWARFMGEWLPASGERLADSPSYEIYRNTPADTSADRLVTELYLPLSAKTT